MNPFCIVALNWHFFSLAVVPLRHFYQLRADFADYMYIYAMLLWCVRATYPPFDLRRSTIAAADIVISFHCAFYFIYFSSFSLNNNLFPFFSFLCIFEFPFFLPLLILFIIFVIVKYFSSTTNNNNNKLINNSVGNCCCRCKLGFELKVFLWFCSLRFDLIFYSNYCTFFICLPFDCGNIFRRKNCASKGLKTNYTKKNALNGFENCKQMAIFINCLQFGA